MSINNFSTDLWAVSINGRLITDWGNTDPPVTSDPINDSSVLRQGLGGNGTRFDRIAPGETVTINLNPGGEENAFMTGLKTSRANIEIYMQQIGTPETAIGIEGLIRTKGTKGRGGANITDGQFIMDFNIWTET